jgi:hypothetical protein
VLAQTAPGPLQWASGLHVHCAEPAAPVQVWFIPQAVPPLYAVQPLACVTHVSSPAPPHRVLPATHCPAGHPHCPPLLTGLHTRDWLEHEAHELPPLPHASTAVPATQDVVLAQQPFAHEPGPHRGVQIVPLPVYPLLHAHVFVAGPVLVHCAFGSHPPLFVLHELTGVQVIPSPV